MRKRSRSRIDNWGKRPRDPFQRWLRARPRRAAKVSLLFTVGMILFWLALISGVILAILISILG